MKIILSSVRVYDEVVFVQNRCYQILPVTVFVCESVLASHLFYLVSPANDECEYEPAYIYVWTAQLNFELPGLSHVDCLGVSKRYILS